MTFEITKIEDWEKLAEKIIPQLKHNILLLKGNLGAGKTTFTKSLVKALGSDDNVDSPTYALVNEYNSPKGKIFHFDLYRVESVEELYDIGIDEYLDSGFLSIIEWPEVYEEELQGLSFHEIKIENDLGIRKVEFQ